MTENDRGDTTEADVRAWFVAGFDVTDTDLDATFGPQWRAIVNLVRRAATLTADDVGRLDVAWAAGCWEAASDVAWKAAWDAASEVAREVSPASAAARAAASEASRVATCAATREAVWGAAWTASWAAATWDLATETGSYTHAHRDLLMKPWADVFGLPDGLIEAAA